ncbi:MAG: glycosyltransferase family 2 protein [Candidatus Eremiobacteraeota bacterium]|nr:glycosyltransferase family 2 protein [Candidatus Eremiobacteraeota bacterium]
MRPALQATYLLPIKADNEAAAVQVAAYLNELRAGVAEIVVVDGSADAFFARLRTLLQPSIRHLRPDERYRSMLNGKVRGVLTGLDVASFDRVVIADDDVRYNWVSLERVVSLLADADVVRPQNVFSELPWHARLDYARTCLNRVFGGDWPGTLAVRRSALVASPWYDGNVLFENLGLVRTVRARGGRERVALETYVTRVPPTTSHFFSQRVRQAYDEFARPARLALFLSLLPAALVLGVRNQFPLLATGALIAIALAETGRRRARGSRFFPITSSLLAPAWLVERAICSWLAVYQRLRYGGVRYGSATIRRAATPPSQLRARWH